MENNLTTEEKKVVKILSQLNNTKKEIFEKPSKVVRKPRKAVSKLKEVSHNEIKVNETLQNRVIKVIWVNKF